MNFNATVLNFLLPTNIISQGIVVIILLLFGIFFFLRARSKQQLASARCLLNMFDSDEAISLLVEQRKMSVANPDIEFKHLVSQIIDGSDTNSKKPYFIDNATSQEDDQEVLHDKNSDSYDKVRNNPIIRHLKSIYVAGCNEARLETEALLRYTENELFNEIFRLKNILAAFIVIGLLGTLIGLGESLSQLSPVLNASGTQKMNIASSLAGLLTHLKSAFAPSVWGILCTIIGMFYYIRFIHTYCNPLQSKLEHLTLNIWIPRLYPGVSQKLIEALSENTKKFVEHVNDAAAVAGFAKEIKEETGFFKTCIHDSQTLLQLLASHVAQFQVSSQGLSSFSSSFEKSVENLTGFQGQLFKLQEDLSSSINNAVVFQNTRIEGLYNHMVEVTKTLSIVDQTYAENVIELNGLVDAVRRNKNIESEKNREISETILKESSVRFEHIETGLHNNMLELTKSLEFNLAQLLSKFDGYDTPVKNAAGKMEKSAENIDNYHQMLTKHIIQINDNMSAQLQSIVTQIKDHNGAFLSKMGDKIENSSSQNEITRQLIVEIRLLNESINQPFWNKFMIRKVA